MFKDLLNNDNLKNRYVITYDYPTYPEEGTDSVIEALEAIGKVKRVPCAPATTIGFTANPGIGDQEVRAAVRAALDENKPERKAVVAQLSMKPGAWSWPEEDTAKARANGTWRKIF